MSALSLKPTIIIRLLVCLPFLLRHLGQWMREDKQSPLGEIRQQVITEMEWIVVVVTG